MIALALLAVVLAAYVHVLAAGETFIGRDHLTHTIPAKTYLAAALAEGRYPEWWAALGMGVPFAGNPNHSAAYPPSWIVAALPMPWSADFLLVLHVWLAGCGAAAFSRRLGADPLGAVVAGGTFMVGGMLSSMLVHGGPLLTAAWAPWIAWASDRVAAAGDWRTRGRAGLALAAFQGAQLLAGDPSIAITSGLIAITVLLVRSARDPRALVRNLATLAASSCAAVMLAAVALVPAFAVLSESQRAGGLAFDDATVWSMHPLRIVEWVWPRALGDANHSASNAARVVADASSGRSGLGTGWALSLHVGLPALVLASLARRKRAWLLACGVFAVLALGRYTPLYGWYRAVFLPEHFVRYPEKHLLGAAVVIAALAGAGFSRVLTGDVSRRARVAAAATISVLAVGVAAAALWSSQLAAAVSARHVDGAAAVGISLQAGIGAVIVAALAAAALQTAVVRRRTWPAAVAAALIVGHLVTETRALLPTIERARIAQPPALLADISPAADQPPRLYRPQQLGRKDSSQTLGDEVAAAHDTAIENSATRFGFHYFRGYDQAHSARMRALWDAGARVGQRLLDRFDVEWVILPASPRPIPGLEATARTPTLDVALLHNTERRPRAFVATDWQWIAAEDVSRAIAATIDAPVSRVVLEGRGAPPTSPGPLTPCEWSSSSAEHVELRCDAPASGYAVGLFSWAPGWTATVDGSRARIERADVLTMAVGVEQGPHTVVFRYRTPGLRLAAVLSALAWLVLIAAGLATRARGARST